MPKKPVDTEEAPKTEYHPQGGFPEKSYAPVEESCEGCGDAAAEEPEA